MALLAPTFGAHAVKLAQYGLQSRLIELNRGLVKLTREAAGPRVWVGGNLSPLGLFVPPYGDTPFEDMVSVYREQADAINSEGVDYFHIETQMTVFEARAAVLGIRAVSLRPIFVSFTCDDKGKTLSGADIEAALLAVQSLGVNAFGLNCVTGDPLPLFRRLARYAAIPLIYKPNAGLPDANGEYHMTPAEMTAQVRELSALGVRLFGACCGSGPEHIQMWSELLDDIMPMSPLGVIPKGTASDSRQVYSDEAPDGDTVYLDSDASLTAFAEDQFVLRGPVTLIADNDHRLEQAFRAYHGIPRVKR
jgi:5-methyltetrahydrofolate--homocysteine methyltransferase